MVHRPELLREQSRGNSLLLGNRTPDLAHMHMQRTPQNPVTCGAFPALRDRTSSPWAATLWNRSRGEAHPCSPLAISAIFQDLGL